MRPTISPLRQRARRRGLGFTLIEMLIVVAILGILANILIPNLLLQLQKAKAVRLIAEYEAVRDAYLTYQTDTGESPRRWNRTRAHPDLVPNLEGVHIVYRSDDGKFRKRLRVYTDKQAKKGRPKAVWILDDDNRRGLLDRIKTAMGDQAEVKRRGRRIILPIA